MNNLALHGEARMAGCRSEWDTEGPEAPLSCLPRTGRRTAMSKIRIAVTAEYPPADAARAQADLEARRTTGSVVLGV